MKIPKLIHQSHVSEDAINEESRKNVSRLKELNPDWEWVFWSDEDNRKLIADHYSWFLPYYDGYKYPIQRADAVRYFYMHRYGGIYLDLDMVPLKPIEELLLKVHQGEVQSLIHSNLPEVVLFEEYPNYFELGKAIYNAIMISQRGAKFWLRTHDLMKKEFRDQGDTPKSSFIFETTGPRLLKSALMDHIIEKKRTEGISVLPYFYSNPTCLPSKEDDSQMIIFNKMQTSAELNQSTPDGPWRRLPPDLNESYLPNSYFIHLGRGSWRKN
ncbi:MAG: glycosyltransferase family 32 protein [Paracoccaceae bacterium]